MYSVLTRNQDINNPDYFKCCCGCHVKQGALTIAIISIVGGFSQLFSGNVFGLYGIVVIAASSLVIYADRKEKAWAYIPYLVVQALGIIGYLVIIVLLLVWAITLPQWLIDSLTKQGTLTHDQIRAACYIAMVILIIGEAFAIWFWSIVFRAYRYMREVLGGPSLDDN
uniref:Uncharacterized protein n=1 Tax=Acrobeloides nanus TaxID=290746 RepID=A0A914CPT9_9BILA